MKKGKMYHPPPRYVVPVTDIDVFGDGTLWTLYVLEEDLEWVEGHRYIRKDARIMNLVCQTPQERFTEVRVRKHDLVRLQRRFEYKRGGIE